MVLRNLVLAVLLIVQFSGCEFENPFQEENSRTVDFEQQNRGQILGTDISEFSRAMVLRYKNEKRLALVIGNNNYLMLKPLANAVNDSKSIGQALEQLDFKVTYLKNGTRKAMNTQIEEFTRLLKRHRGVGMVFYAGHGLEVGGQNYLIPTDAIIDDKLDIKTESVALNDIIYRLEKAGNRLNIVVLDACRNNPFKDRSITRKVLGENIGLANPPKAKGIYIAYSADVGEEAQDGSGKNGTFTKFLLVNLKKDGLKLNDVFKYTRRDVEIETEGKR